MKTLKKLAGPLIIEAAAVMIFAGLFFGEARAVLDKAVMICLECIGIG